MNLTMKQAVANALRSYGPQPLPSLISLTKQHGSPEWLNDQVQIMIVNLCTYKIIENSPRTNGLYWFRNEALPELIAA